MKRRGKWKEGEKEKKKEFRRVTRLWCNRVNENEILIGSIIISLIGME